MKITKPHPITYRTNYLIMRCAPALFAITPTSILQRLIKRTQRYINHAHDHPNQMHPDRYDMAADWNYHILRTLRSRIA